MSPQGHSAREIAPDAFSVESHCSDGVRVICPVGELDLASADVVLEELERAERSDAEAIELDLSRVTFMDSTGVRLVLGAQARARTDATKRFRVRRGRPAVQRVFEICGVDALLPYVD